MAKKAHTGFEYSGSASDLFLQECRTRLRVKIGDYFVWIEQEARLVTPSAFRQESVEQCIGAIVSIGRKYREITVSANARMMKIPVDNDGGSWIDLDDQAIRLRGARLIAAMGLGSDTKLTTRLNLRVADHQWFFSMLSILALAIALIGLCWNIANALPK